jgi:hypothetical protein
LKKLKIINTYKSYKYFLSGWVLEVRWRRYQRNEVVLVKVRHSFAVGKAPLQPWVIVRYNGVVVVGHCTCMAGLAETCSHVGALLHWIENTVRTSKEVSGTSQSNEWIVPRSVKSIPYKQLKDIKFRTTNNHLSTSGAIQTSDCRAEQVDSPTEEEKSSFYDAIARDQDIPWCYP